MFGFSPGKLPSPSKTTRVPGSSPFRHRTVQKQNIHQPSAVRELPKKTPSQNRESSIPRSRRPWILFYHLIHFNSATSGLADLGQICIQAALSGSPRTIHHCRVNRNSSENTFITQSAGKKDDLLGQAGRPSKTAVCHSKFRQSSEMTSSNASISVQHLQNGTIKTLSYPADPPGKEVTCVGIFMAFFFRKASSFLDGVY